MTSEKFHRLFDGPPRQPERWITQKEMDLAASIQSVCEEVVLRAARHAHALTGLRHLVMAGGVALNCVANGRLAREGPFESIWVQPAAGDAGGALGAALLVWHHLLGKPRPAPRGDSQQGSFLGPQFSSDEIGIFLDSVGAHYEYVPEEAPLVDRVASLLIDEKVVGWFQGRMEYGPRALGARSILGDARSADAADDESEDQVSRVVPSVRALYPPGARPPDRRDAGGRGLALHALRGRGATRAAQSAGAGRARADAEPRPRRAGSGPAVERPGRDPRRLLGEGSDGGSRAARTLPPSAAEILRADRMPGAGEHELQHPWGADRVYPGRRLPLLHVH